MRINSPLRLEPRINYLRALLKSEQVSQEQNVTLDQFLFVASICNMSIKFLLDENIPYSLIDLLQKRCFDVQHLKKTGKQGIKNGEVYEIAESEKIWIVTRDADFQNSRRFYQYSVASIVLFKLMRSKTEHLLNVMIILLNKQKDRFAGKNLIIVEDYEVKIYEGQMLTNKRHLEYFFDSLWAENREFRGMEPRYKVATLREKIRELGSFNPCQSSGDYFYYFTSFKLTHLMKSLKPFIISRAK